MIACRTPIVTTHEDRDGGDDDLDPAAAGQLAPLRGVDQLGSRVHDDRPEDRRRQVLDRRGEEQQDDGDRRRGGQAR